MAHQVCFHFVCFRTPGLQYTSGIVSWNDPTSVDIKAAATAIGQQLVLSLTSFALNPNMVFTTYIWHRVHFGTWSVGAQTLVIGVNLGNQVRTIPLTQLPRCEEDEQLDVLYNVGTTFESGNMVFEGLGAIGFKFVVSA